MTRAHLLHQTYPRAPRPPYRVLSDRSDPVADQKPDPTALDTAQLCLIARFTEDLLGIDWSDPEAVALAEKRARIHSLLVTTTQKVPVKTHDADPITPEQRAAAEAELERRLLRLKAGLERDRKGGDRRDAGTGPGTGAVRVATMGARGPGGATR